MAALFKTFHDMPFPFAYWQGGFGQSGPDFMNVLTANIAGGTSVTFTVRNPMATDMDIVWTPDDLVRYNTIADSTGIKPGEIRLVSVTKKAVSPKYGTTISWVWTSGMQTGTRDCTGSYTYFTIENEEKPV